MRRNHLVLLPGLLCLATLATSARADTSLREEVEELRQRAEALESQREMFFRREIESYLARTDVWRRAAGGDGLAGVTMDARFTAVGLATLNADPGNRHSVHGDVDLDFGFEVHESLDLFIHVTANTDGAFPDEFGPAAGSGGATLSGLFDGIGVDGTVSTSPGSARVDEAGIHWRVPVRDRTLHVILGKLDPRDRFAQNAFAGDENTQFLNNLFDDPPAMSWPTNASGTTIFAVHLWTTFGDRDQYRVDFGFYNEPGQFFNDGILLGQLGWTGELDGRELNVRIYGQFDTVPEDGSAAVGVSADWWATEKIGVFARFTVHDNQPFFEMEPNSIESDWQIGAVFVGLVPDRPDDELGVAWGMVKGPIAVAAIPGASENSEMVIEIYYRYMHEEGKLQITPLVQFLVDPGAATFGEPDSLVILGLRFFVPF